MKAKRAPVVVPPDYLELARQEREQLLLRVAIAEARVLGMDNHATELKRTQAELERAYAAQTTLAEERDAMEGERDEESERADAMEERLAHLERLLERLGIDADSSSNLMAGMSENLPIEWVQS